MSTFELWMASLDPIRLAAEESFHSSAHRAAMELHELEKLRLQAAAPSLSRHDNYIQEVADIWALRDARDTPPVLPVVRPRKVEVRPSRKATHKEPEFTQDQIRIAQAVLNRKAS